MGVGIACNQSISSISVTWYKWANQKAGFFTFHSDDVTRTARALGDEFCVWGKAVCTRQPFYHDDKILLVNVFVVFRLYPLILIIKGNKWKTANMLFFGGDRRGFVKVSDGGIAARRVRQDFRWWNCCEGVVSGKIENISRACLR